MRTFDPAWGALIIAIVGSVVGPIATTLLTNIHEDILRNKDVKQRLAENYDQNRHEAICSFMSSVGKVLATGSADNLEDFGRDFFGVYPYVPDSLRKRLDSFYRSLVIDGDFSSARKKFPGIAADLSSLLKREPPKHLFQSLRKLIRPNTPASSK